MSTPSIFVVNCGRVFKLASNLRQSYCVPQYWTRVWIVASCTPCDKSPTVSLSGHRVSSTRRRRSSSSDCRMLTRNGCIEVSFETTESFEAVTATGAVCGAALVAPATQEGVAVSANPNAPAAADTTAGVNL